MDNPFELPKDLLHEAIMGAIEITNLSNRIIRSYFGMELKFGGEEDNWGVLNANELNRFNDFFLENLWASSRADLLLEIKEELKKCKDFKNKLINLYKIRNIFAHNIFPKDLQGNTRLESSTPHWIELNKQHKELYEELKEFLESVINSKMENKEEGEITFSKRKGKLMRYSAEKDGTPFYIFVEGEDKGDIKQIMEKPNFKEMEKQIHWSGLHVILDFPERDHYDHYQGDKKWQEKKTDSNNPYWVSGGTWGI